MDNKKGKKKKGSVSQFLSRFRGLFQAGAALLTNLHLPNFLKGGIYQGKGKETCLDADGKVREGLLKARERGVLFDASNGCNNFDLEIAQKAVAQGFKPDIISSDINTSGFFLQPLHSLPRIMSKYLDFGMSLSEVLDTVTRVPARLVHRESLASMAPGTEADLVIFKVKEKEVPYSDRTGHTFTGHQVIVPQLTMKDGVIMYCQADFM